MRRLLLCTAITTLQIVFWGCAARPPAPARVDNPLDAMEGMIATDPNDISYVLGRMEYSGTAIRMGCYLRAKPKLLEAARQFDMEHDSKRAALSSERYKYYKGETYERAMIWWYLGYIEYVSGNFNDARICFERSRDTDGGSVVDKNTPKIYGQDFGLAYYWLGKTYAALGDAGNSRIAFEKAGVETPRKDREKELAADRKVCRQMEKRRQEGEDWAFRTFHDPKKAKHYIEGISHPSDRPNSSVATSPCSGVTEVVLRRPANREELLTAAYQEHVNLTMTIELGNCPFKKLAGLQGERTEILRSFNLPATVNVFVDGQPAGVAYKILDLWDQAATQDRIAEKDAAQTGKAIGKEILRRMPYIGGLFSYWDVSGDMRAWSALSGQVLVCALRVSPGPHAIRLEMMDVNGTVLPRWTNSYYGVMAAESREQCLLLRPCYDGDNVLSPELMQKAMAAGALPMGEESWYAMSLAKGKGGF